MKKDKKQTEEVVETKSVKAEAVKTEPEKKEQTDETDVFAVLEQETKWEKKERRREEKAKAKQAKKRAKYADVDDDTYYAMKAGGFHKAFGVFSILLLLAGMGLAALSVYKLVVHPASEDVRDSVGDLEVVTYAAGESVLSEQRVKLEGLSTDTDALYDTWEEEPFEATETDAAEHEHSHGLLDALE